MTASVPIWFEDLAVGHVDVAADGSLSLRYADRWLQTAGAFPLSVTMPPPRRSEVAGFQHPEALFPDRDIRKGAIPINARIVDLIGWVANDRPDVVGQERLHAHKAR